SAPASAYPFRLHQARGVVVHGKRTQGAYRRHPRTSLTRQRPGRWAEGMLYPEGVHPYTPSSFCTFSLSLSTSSAPIITRGAFTSSSSVGMGSMISLSPDTLAFTFPPFLMPTFFRSVSLVYIFSLVTTVRVTSDKVCSSDRRAVIRYKCFSDNGDLP